LLVFVVLTTETSKIRAGIINTQTSDLKDLEDFAVILDGRPYQSVDENFWGITFADDQRFYATMSTHGVRYLVAGDFAAATVRTIASNVECPSLSPDGHRIAFKEAIAGNPAKGWRFTVLDLATLARTHLAETAVWTTRRCGWTTRRSPTPSRAATARTSGRCRPTGPARRDCSSRTPSRRPR